MLLEIDIGAAPSVANFEIRSSFSCVSDRSAPSTSVCLPTITTSMRPPCSASDGRSIEALLTGLAGSGRTGDRGRGGVGALRAGRARGGQCAARRRDIVDDQHGQPARLAHRTQSRPARRLAASRPVSARPAPGRASGAGRPRSRDGARGRPVIDARLRSSPALAGAQVTMSNVAGAAHRAGEAPRAAAVSRSPRYFARATTSRRRLRSMRSTTPPSGARRWAARSASAHACTAVLRRSQPAQRLEQRGEEVVDGDARTPGNNDAV